MAPRLRNDLVAAFTEEDGVTCVEVTDPLTATNFRFYDFEYALAQQLNGQPLEAVVAWAAATYGTELPPDALDAFVEKLAGLGFLVGSSAGAQPAELAPPSSSSAEVPFGELSTTVGAGAPPPPADSEVPGMEAFAAEIAASIVDDEATLSAPVQAGPMNAAAPEGLLAGDATEYRLKQVEQEREQAASGLWEPARLGTPAPVALPSIASIGPAGAPPAPSAPERVPGGMQMLGGPLPPPPAAIPGWGGISDLDEEGPSGLDVDEALAALGESPESPAPAGETPLGFIAQAVAAVESSSAAPLGALDTSAAPPPAAARPPAPLPSIPVRAPLPPAPSVTAAVAEAARAPGVGETPAHELNLGAGLDAGLDPGLEAGSWAAAVEDQIEHPRPERRQPPRPELVVMPPTAPPVAAEPSIAVPLPRRRSTALLVVLLLVAAASSAVWFLRPGEEPAAPPVVASAPTVHVVSPQPTTFYRWFETTGTVSPGRDDTLSFTRAGKLQDAMAPGTTFAAGEPIARLKGVSDREVFVNKIRSRVAFLEQLRDSSRAQGEAALHQAEIKLEAKRQELVKMQAWQAELEIRPKVAGEIAQLMVAKGALVAAGTPVFHVRAAGPQAMFALSADDITKARALGFCRLETIPGSAAPAADGGAAPEAAGARPIDCAFAAPTAAPADARLVVDVGHASGVTPGTQVRLASARYDGVYPVPGAALVREGTTTRLWVTTASRTASDRTVEVAATIDELALISRGLSVGDAIIVDPPATLKEGAEINVAR